MKAFAATVAVMLRRFVRTGRTGWRSWPWTKDDVRALKTLAREKTKTTVIRAQAEAERRSDVSKGRGAQRVAGGRGRGKKRDKFAERWSRGM
jgi:hypothetical protein